MPSPSARRNVLLLASCQALFMSGMSLIIATSALVGFALAENKAYATLPFAAQLIASMLTSIPAAFLMKRIGRKAAFLLASLIAAAGGGVATVGILQQSYAGFVAGCIGIGIFTGFANYYRFVAADVVQADYKSRAISYVLGGGVIAAIVGPNLANLTRDLLGPMFAGSYAAAIMLYILSFILLTFLRLDRKEPDATASPESAARPLPDIVRQPRFIVAALCGMLGYAVMSLIMTATPLAMHHHAHPFTETSFVIQWHVLGMTAPSFFTGHLIRRFGLLPVMLSGVVFGIACVAINLHGTSVAHFWTALLLLGLSWNFLFIGATTLLTETYRPAERFKVQALNDFLVFSLVAAASLSAGALQHSFGWDRVNQGAIPALLVILVSLLWLRSQERTPQSLPPTSAPDKMVSR